MTRSGVASTKCILSAAKSINIRISPHIFASGPREKEASEIGASLTGNSRGVDHMVVGSGRLKVNRAPSSFRITTVKAHTGLLSAFVTHGGVKHEHSV
jgi:hypothetical protein